LTNQTIFLTVFKGFEAMKNLKMLWLPGLRLGPHWGSLQRSLRPPCWNKQYFIRNNYRNAPEKSNSELRTPNFRLH